MIRLKISKYDQSHILLEALEGIDHFGFGTFLCDLKPTEIECDGFSKESIINSEEKDGLNGMEIWNDNRIAWGDPSESIIIPIDEISNMSTKDGWISQIKETD